MCFQNFRHISSILAAIHLFISSHDEIKDFCSMDKKTGRRYLRRVRIYTSIHLQTFVLSVTVGSVNPAAHFCVREICIFTNNFVSIKYLHQTSNQKIYHTHHCVSSKFFTPIIRFGGDTPFYAFGYEIEDFYLTRKKTGRRYVRRMHVYT